ncbi:MAG TPA: hypothetical protein VGH90_07225 [Chthoniobacteraceae bacterium]
MRSTHPVWLGLAIFAFAGVATISVSTSRSSAADPSPPSPPAEEEGNPVPPATEGGKAAKILQNIDWDELVRQSNVAPFEVNPGATTEAETHAKFVAWTKIRLLDPELERLKGDPNEAALRTLFERATGFFTSREPPSLDDGAIKQLIEQVKGPVRRPCLDYLCAAILEELGRTDPADQAYRYSADAAADSGLPSICRLYAAGVLLLRAEHFKDGDRGAAEKKFLALFAENLADTPVDDEDLRHTLVAHLGGTIDQARVGREHQCIDLYEKSTLPEWARLAMIGQTEMQWAYRLGGQDVFDARKKDRNSAAAESKKAKQALARSWELNPKSPYAAQNLIIGVGRGGRADPAELRKWLDRSLAAECDFELAFKNYFWSWRDTDQSELPDLLATGRACADTGRFDTELPTMFNLALCEAACSLSDWRTFFTRPAISKPLLEVRQKRVAKAAGGPDETEQLEQLAFEAWLTGDDALAARSIAPLSKSGRLPFLYAPVRFNAYLLSVDPEIALRDGALRGGPHAADYKRAVAELSAGQASAAIGDFQKAQPDEDPYARPLVDADLELAKFAERFAGGDWTPLPAGHRLCWAVQDGEWNWRPGVKRIRFTCSEHMGRTFFRGALGADFELRGHLNASRPSRRPGGVTFYCGHTPVGAGVDATDATAIQVFCDDERALLVQYVPEEKMGGVNGSKTVSFPKETTFLYRVHAGKISFSIGDKELLHEKELPEGEPTGEGAFGIGALGYGDGSFGEVWGLEARVVTAQ